MYTGRSMKSRLSASISLLNLGEQRRSFCFTNAFSSSLGVLFNGRRRGDSRCQYQGLQSSRTVNYSREDDFADLGPPSEGLISQFKLLTQKPELKGLQSSRTVNYSRKDDFADLGPPSEGLATQLKLLTQKPELNRNGPKTKGSSRSSSPGSRQSIFSFFQNFDKPSQTSKSVVKDCDNLSGRYGDMKKPSNLSNSCSVTAEDVTDGVDYCDSDFEIVTIRIQGIAKETTDHIIHSICKSIGALEGLVKVNDAVDVLFRVKNEADSQYIVKRLNDTLIDDTQWSAFECPKISTSSSSSEDALSKIGLQINSGLHDMKQQFEYKKMLFEDLLTLHMAVMHLEGLPTTLEPPNKH